MGVWYFGFLGFRCIFGIFGGVLGFCCIFAILVDFRCFAELASVVTCGFWVLFCWNSWTVRLGVGIRQKFDEFGGSVWTFVLYLWDLVWFVFYFWGVYFGFLFVALNFAVMVVRLHRVLVCLLGSCLFGVCVLVVCFCLIEFVGVCDYLCCLLFVVFFDLWVYSVKLVVLLAVKVCLDCFLFIIHLIVWFVFYFFICGCVLLCYLFVI